MEISKFLPIETGEAGAGDGFVEVDADVAGIPFHELDLFLVVYGDVPADDGEVKMGLSLYWTIDRFINPKTRDASEFRPTLCPVDGTSCQRSGCSPALPYLLHEYNNSIIPGRWYVFRY